MGQFKLHASASNNPKELKSALIKTKGAFNHYFQQEIQNSSNTFGISPNDNYLACKTSDKIRITKLQNSQHQSTLHLKHKQKLNDNNDLVSCLGYFQDNKIMFCVTNNLIILLQKNYKKISAINSQNGCINGVKIINKSQILTCCQDFSIIITDYSKKNQLLKIPNHNNISISQVEFDSYQQVIISNSFDMSMKFYKINGEKIIDYKDSTFYYQIQIVNNTNYLIGRSHDSVVLWQVDYQQRELNKLKEFKNSRIIYRISTFHESGIILIDSKELKILNLTDFKVISRQRHQVRNIICNNINILDDRNSKLMNSNNYLAITSYRQIKILKSVIQLA